MPRAEISMCRGVIFHGTVGSLTLTHQKLIFEPGFPDCSSDDDDDDNDNGGTTNQRRVKKSRAWHWDVIKKFRVVEALPVNNSSASSEAPWRAQQKRQLKVYSFQKTTVSFFVPEISVQNLCNDLDSRLLASRNNGGGGRWEKLFQDLSMAALDGDRSAVNERAVLADTEPFRFRECGVIGVDKTVEMGKDPEIRDDKAINSGEKQVLKGDISTKIKTSYHSAQEPQRHSMGSSPLQLGEDVLAAIEFAKQYFHAGVDLDANLSSRNHTNIQNHPNTTSQNSSRNKIRSRTIPLPSSEQHEDKLNCSQEETCLRPKSSSLPREPVRKEKPKQRTRHRRSNSLTRERVARQNIAKQRRGRSTSRRKRSTSLPPEPEKGSMSTLKFTQSRQTAAPDQNGQSFRSKKKPLLYFLKSPTPRHSFSDENLLSRPRAKKLDTANEAVHADKSKKKTSRPSSTLLEFIKPSIRRQEHTASTDDSRLQSSNARLSNDRTSLRSFQDELLLEMAEI